MIPSISFYNHIAKDYNAHMTESDQEVRKMVMNAFVHLVAAGNVLDFGGGTGLDLPWLLKNNYAIQFLEPSSEMLALAKRSITRSESKLVFVEENMDFHDWSATSLPFKEKLNGILANFAVFNCIEDIQVLFEKLSPLCAPGCKIFATIIDATPIKLFKSYSFKAAIKSLVNMPLVIQNNHKGVTQHVYLHTKSRYKAASSKYFEFVSYLPLKSSHFAILILSKK